MSFHYSIFKFQNAYLIFKIVSSSLVKRYFFSSIFFMFSLTFVNILIVVILKSLSTEYISIICKSAPVVYTLPCYQPYLLASLRIQYFFLKTVFWSFCIKEPQQLQILKYFIRAIFPFILLGKEVVRLINSFLPDNELGWGMQFGKTQSVWVIPVSQLWHTRDSDY